MGERRSTRQAGLDLIVGLPSAIGADLARVWLDCTAPCFRAISVPSAMKGDFTAIQEAWWADVNDSDGVFGIKANEV